MTQPAAPEPIPDEEVEQLRRRLRDTRVVRLPPVAQWARGTDANYLAELIRYWHDEYDWRAHEARIAALPWVRTAAGPALHQPATSENAPALLLLHGWPDSVLRFERVLPMLTDVNVIVPPLPGYPFGDPLVEVGTSATHMADRIAGIVAELGYDRYTVSGGDVGAGVAEQLAYRYAENVASLHLTNIPYGRIGSIDPAELNDDENTYATHLKDWRSAEGAYAHEHATKPHTLAVGLGDSPAGLLAWIVEKLRSWSDSGGDVESVFTRDELLTWVSAYWFTNTIGTSFGPYFEQPEPAGRIDAPTYVTQFPLDIASAPEAFGRRFYDIRSWHDEPDGGHFGAWERPEVFVERVREALTPG